jgi:hypothetical protein
MEQLKTLTVTADAPVICHRNQRGGPKWLRAKSSSNWFFMRSQRIPIFGKSLNRN